LEHALVHDASAKGKDIPSIGKSSWRRRRRGEGKLGSIDSEDSDEVGRGASSENDEGDIAAVSFRIGRTNHEHVTRIPK
jgi:hypothetical protein